jgi:hypothetical protein
MHPYGPLKCYLECLDGHGQINQHGKGVFAQSVWFLH